MANFSFVISYQDQFVRQFNHDTGILVRTIGSYNASWTPASSNFNTTTGLPESFALGATEFNNLCSLAAEENSVYALDVSTCRVLRIVPDTGTVVATFGGRRGIGSGHIEPETIARSIVAVANSFVWVTDNAGGFLLKYTLAGTFVAEYSVATLSSGAGVTFDQITGFAYDSARGVYWLLASSSANTYLVEVDVSGVATGENVDLTARRGIPGHSGSPAGRVLTRGLQYRNGYLYVWSDDDVHRIDLLGTSGDLTVASAISTVTPGPLSATEIVYGTKSLTAGLDTVTVATLASGVTRGYADAVTEINEPLDIAVTPATLDTSTRTSRDLTLRARIRATATQTLQLRAAIRAVSSQTQQLRARILSGIQNRLQLRARIEEPTSVPDGWVESWEISDEFGAYSQRLSLQVSQLGTFQVNNEVIVYAGYQLDRIKLITARIDDVQENRTPDQTTYSISARNDGAKELDSIKITRTFESTPLTNMPGAHQIIRDVAAQVGLQVGALEFPDYELHNTYVAFGKTFSQIVSELIEPFNQFARVQHVLIIRERLAQVIRIDYQNPPANGIQIEQQHLEQRGRQQTAYLDAPRLNEVETIIIRGASYTTPRANLGTQSKVEYFRNIVTADVQNSIASQVSAPGDPIVSVGTPAVQNSVTQETVVVQSLYGDKILDQIKSEYADGEIVERTKDRFFYIEPGDDVSGLIVPASATAIVNTSTFPTDSSIPWITTSRREGLIERNGTLQFTEVFRAVTQYFYDEEGQLAYETHTTQELDEDTFVWGITKTSSRYHSPQTGSVVRTQLSNFTFEDSRFQIDSVDVQAVGGTRPDPRNIASRKNLLTHQVQAPQGEFDDDGNPIDFGEGRITWTFDNAYIGQDVADYLYELALAEREFQLLGYKWETVPFTSVLNPNIHVAQGARIEVSDGTFKNYWIQSVNHSFSTDAAMTTGTGRRLTLDNL